MASPSPVLVVLASSTALPTAPSLAPPTKRVAPWPPGAMVGVEKGSTLVPGTRCQSQAGNESTYS